MGQKPAKGWGENWELGIQNMKLVWELSESTSEATIHKDVEN